MKNLVAPRWISGHFQLVDLWRQIRDVAAINPESLAETTLPDLEFDYVDLAAVDEGTIASVLVSHRFESAPSRARRITQEGDLLVATVRPLLDGHTRVPKQGFRQLIASTGYAVLRIKDPNERDLVWHLLTSRLVRRQFHAKVAGSSYPAIAESDVGEIWIPKFKEHLVYRVVRACNALQSSESILNRLIAAKREQKRGLMQQLLTGKLRFPGFTEPWKTVRLEEVVSLRNSKAVASEAPDLHCIELEHIEQGTGELIGRARAGSTVSLKTEFASGDVLFGKLRPYLKKFALVDFAGFCSTEIWAITANRIAITSAYLRLLVESPAIQRAANATSGTKMPRADWDVVAATAVKLPSIVEQERITALTSTIEAELRLLNAQRAAFAAQRRGLMEKLLSGEIDIQNPKETAA